MTETMTLENGPMRVPAGGIASFRLSDEDLANLDREQDEQLAEEVYGSGGISRFTEIASDMAGLGRYGDDVVVHAQTGELIIPKRILDESPEIRSVVYQALREQGIEDPEQYVVGSGSASINPNTGLAEYGFFKGIKKAFKQVVKVVKKIAPIVLPIALAIAFPALGPIYGAALGSGIGTLIQGGSIKDALKSAAIAGLSGAAYSGFTGPGTFSQNVSGSLADPGARFAQVGGQLKSGFSGQGFDLGQQFTPPASGQGASGQGALRNDLNSQTTGQPTTNVDPQYGGMSDAEFNVNNNAINPEAQFRADTRLTPQSSNAQIVENSSPMSGDSRNINLYDGQIGDSTPRYDPNKVFNSPSDSALPDNRSFYEKSKDFMFGKEPTSVDIAKAKSDAYTSAIKEGYSPADANYAANKIAEKAAEGPGYLRTFGPAAGIALGATYLGGGFDTPEEEPVNILDRNSDGSVRTGQDLYRENEARYKVGDLYTAPISYTTPDTSYQSYANINPFQIPTIGTGNPFYRPSYQTVAQGGEIFPRRNGGIMPNEGIPGQDSVRAMLMPGEFVMTTDAVKGAGGIPNMYHMMSALERKGRMA